MYSIAFVGQAHGCCGITEWVARRGDRDHGCGQARAIHIGKAFLNGPRREVSTQPLSAEGGQQGRRCDMAVDVDAAALGHDVR